MPRDRKPALAPRIEQDGITWIEIGQAARLSRTKAAAIKVDVAAGRITSIIVDGAFYIPLTAANRLKRESATMIAVRRLNKKRTLPPARNPGVLSKETQNVLPMSSGRSGRGWLGQRTKE